MSPLDRLDWLRAVAAAGAPRVALVMAIDIAKADGGEGAWGASLGESVSDRGGRKGRAWLIAQGFLARHPGRWCVRMPDAATGTPVPENGTPVPDEGGTPVPDAARMCRSSGTPVPGCGTLVPENGTPVPPERGGTWKGDTERGGALTGVDPDPSDITTPTTGSRPAGHEDPTVALGAWVRTGTQDPTRSAELRAALQAYVARFGLVAVARAAEHLAMQAGGKIWPDDLLPALATQRRHAAPIAALPDFLPRETTCPTP